MSASRTPAVELTGLHVETGTTVDDPTRLRFWQVYREAFEPLRIKAAARHVLTEDEFAGEMTDERVVKYVVRDGAGTAWAMMLVTRDLTAVPWIEPAYYAHHFPGEYTRGTIFYLGFAAVHPLAQGSACFAMMLEHLAAEIVAAGGILCADVCRTNADAQLPRAARALMSRAAAVTSEVLDTQSYLHYTFTPRG
jgi:hypothetical protein